MSTAAVDAREERRTTPEEIPLAVQQRMERGRGAMKKDSAKRRLYYKFWRGDTYSYIDSKGALQTQQSGLTLQRSKLSWRIRNKYPFIAMIVGAKVSAATQRVPSYEVVPTTTDIGAEQAATLAERVALYGYDKWRLRRATVKLVEHAFVGGEGFAYPYFDSTVGPYMVDPETEEVIGQGEVKVKILSANEVYWEPGCDFDDSPWCVVEQAMPLDVVRAMPGYIEGELKPDATDSESPTDTSSDNLVIVSEYLERPSPKRPRGRRIVQANRRRIVPDEDYPCQDAKGEVQDEPLLVRLSYIVEVDDRDRGLVEMLVDLQRTIQDCLNKILEIKNRGLNLQMTAPRGSQMSRRDDQPGAVWFYNPVGGQKPAWEPPPSPQFLSNLLQILDKAIELMRALAADVDVQPDPRLTSTTAAQAIEQAQLRWQSFLGDLAEAHSRIMRRCLYLVQRHYSEERDLKIQGVNGPDYLPGFLGADLLGQADVRVSPSSLEVKSRKSVIDETILFADRGWITPQAAMAVIQGGIAENLWKGWIKDVGRANKIIQTIKQGPEAFATLPDRPAYPGEGGAFGPDGAPLLPGPGGMAMVPGYMPRPFDNVAIHREVFEGWMKTAEYDRLGPAQQHQAMIYYDALLRVEAQQQAKAAIQEEQTAQAMGMSNAAKQQEGPQLPSQPTLQGPRGAEGGSQQA